MDYPTIHSIETSKDYNLIVTFDNGTKKLYDCNKLIETDLFANLKDPIQFNMAKAEKYGVVWNKDLDLSEYELWTNGKTIEK